MTPSQIAYFMHHLPHVEMRRHLPVAQLEAALRNFAGGKPEPGSSGRGLPEHRQYTALELLPPYARPAEYEQQITAEAARDYLANIRHVPEWALQLIPIELVTQAAR